MKESFGIAIRSMDDLGRLSNLLAGSGFFKDARDAHQIGVKILAGMEMGFDPIAAMTGIHIVQGKIQVGANLLASAIKRSAKYDYQVARDKDGNQRFNDEECVLVFYEQRGKDDDWLEIGISSFNREDAKRAKTQNTDKFPRNMFFARAMSNGVKWFCPDVFLGIAAYTEGEIEDVPQQGIPVIPEGVDVLDLDAEVQPDPNEVFNNRVTELGLDFTTARKYLKESHNVTTPADLEPGNFEQALNGLNSLVKIEAELSHV